MCKEVTALRDGMANLTSLVEPVVAAQNQPPPPSPSPHATHSQQKTFISEVLSIPIYVTTVTTTQYRISRDYPWGMPENFMPEYYNLAD